MTDYITLLPYNSTALERNVEKLTAQVGGLPVPLRDIWNPEEAPEHLLPWLAWGFSVESWENSWSVDIKRRVIRDAIALHRIKGTKAAVAQSLGVLGMDIELREWFEVEGAPYTFQLDVFADDVIETGFQIGPALYEAVSRRVDHVKPVRAHYDLRVGERFTAGIYARTEISGSRPDYRELDPTPQSTQPIVTEHVRTAMRGQAISAMSLDLEPPTDRLYGGVYSRHQTRQTVLSQMTHIVE